MSSSVTKHERLECNACDWKGPRSEAVHFKHDASVLLCPECKETTVQSAPLSSNQCDAWILWFADIDREQIHFGGHGAEVAARKAYDNAKMAWTCRLYHCISHSGFGPESAHETPCAAHVGAKHPGCPICYPNLTVPELNAQYARIIHLPVETAVVHPTQTEEDAMSLARARADGTAERGVDDLLAHLANSSK